MSMKRIQTFSFGVMQSFSMFTIFDSRIPRSTTRASSIASGRGGPASKVGLAIGMSSTLVERTPVFGVSGYGSPTDILMPTKTSVLPSFTRALPSAVLTNARSRLTFRVPKVVLVLVQVEAHDAVNLAGRARRHEVPHRDAGIREGHARRGQARAPSPCVRLEDLDEDVDGRARELLCEDDGAEGLGDYLRDFDRTPIGARAFAVRDAERRHVIPALDERPRRILEVPRMGLPRAVYGREDLVPAPFHVCGPVRPPEDPGLEPDRSQFVELAAVEPAPVCVYQLHLLRKVLDVFHGKPSSRGPRLFRRPLNQFPYGFGEADRLGPFLDQPDRHRRDRGAPAAPVQPDQNVLADIYLPAGHG